MNNKAYETMLSSTGYVTTPEKLITVKFLNIMYAERIQSRSFKGNVVSIPDIFWRNGTDVDALMVDLRETLSRYFSRWFREVDVTVTDSTIGKDSTNRELDIAMQVIDDDGKRVDLFFVLLKSNNSTDLIMTNNTGERVYLTQDLSFGENSYE